MRILNSVKTILLVAIMICSMINPYFTISTKVAKFLGIEESTYIDFKTDYVTDLLLGKDGEYVDDETEAFARVYVKSILVQLMKGNQDEEAVKAAFDALPHTDSYHTDNAYEENNIIDKALVNAFDNEKSILPEDIREALKMLSLGVYDAHVYLADTDYEGVYKVRASYLTCEGEIITMDTGLRYDSNTGCLYGSDNKGLFGIGFDYNAKEYVLYTPRDPWQRALGFNVLYDILGDIVYMDSKTVRIKFNYDGVDRMVQLWMGNYTKSTNGAEIGIYYLEDGKKFHYSCVDENGELPISMTLSANDKKILSLSSEKHWWLAGFKLGPAIDKNDMRLDFTIDFLDEAYAKAFCESAAGNGLVVEQNGSVVNAIWQ